MNHQHTRHSGGDLIPYDMLEHQQRAAIPPHRHHQPQGRAIDPFNHNMMMMQPHYQDPLGPSLFGPSTLMPHRSASSMLEMMNRQHQQLAQATGFGHFGGLNDHTVGFGGRSFDSMMDHMTAMMPLGGAGFDQTPSGHYSSQVMMMSSTTGPDGRQHVEKYARASTGNTQHKIRETKEAYSNSAAGVDKLAWERQLQNRGRRVVQERNRATGEVVSNDEVAGMNRDDECDRFNNEWNDVAQQHLPMRANLPIAPEGLQYPNSQQQQTRQIQAADAEDEEVVEQHPPRRSTRRSHRQQA